MADAHKNFAYTTVTVAPSPATSGTSLTVADGTVLPAVPFNATVWVTGANPLNSNAEIVRVTNNASGVLTLLRAQEGSTARAIVVGDQFAATITAQTLTDAELTISDGTNTQGSGTIRLSNANGVSFGLNAGTLTASHNGLTTAAQSNHSHGNPQLNLTNLTGTTASNSAGFTLSLSGPPAGLTTARASNDAIGLNTALTANGVAWTVNSSGLSLNIPAFLTTAALSNHSHGNPTLNLTNLSGTTASNSAGLTLSLSANPAQTVQPGIQSVSAGTTRVTTGEVVWSNANGVSFGVDGQTITATVRTDYLTTAALSNHSHGNPTLALTNLSGTTASNSAGLTLSLSAAAGGGGADGYNVLAAGTQTATTAGTVLFENSNGVTFGMSGSTRITASHNGLTTARASNDGIGLATAQSNVTWTVNSAGLSLDGRGYAGTGTTFNGANISGSVTLNSVGVNLSLSVAPGGGGADGYNMIAAGTQTAATTGTVLFQNGNGITFGMSNSSVVTASHNGLTTARASNDAVGLNTALTAGPLAWTVNSAGISLNAGSAAGTTSGFAGNLISGSMTHNTAGLNLSLNHPAWLTTAMQSNAVTLSNIRVSAGTTSNLLSALTMANGNGVSFGLDAGTITASVAAQSVQTQSTVAILGSTGAISFGNANGITFGGNASTVTASHNGLTSQSNQAVSGSNGSFTFQTVTFGNLNGVSFYTSNGSMVASHNGLTTAAASDHSHGNPTLALTNLSGTTASASNGFTLSLSAAAPGGGGLTPVASASNGSFSFTTLAFSNANNVTFGTSAGSIITASVAAPGAAAEQNAINLLGANTAGNTTATGSTIGWSGQNLTLSGTNGSQVVISAPATSSLSATGIVSISTNGSTISIGAPGADTRNYFNPQDGYVQVAGQQGQASMHIQPMYAPNVTFDRVAMPVVVTNATNSTGTVTVSFGIAIYTRNGSTLSSLSSTSASQAVTFSGTVNNSTYAGMRLFTFPWSSSLSEAQYYLGIWSRTTTGGANATVSQFLASQVNSVFSGILGAASNATVQYTRGLGVYNSTFSTALPAAVEMSRINGTASIVLRQPVIYFANGTF